MKMEGLQLAMKLFDGKILKGVWLFFWVYALNVQLLKALQHIYWILFCSKFNISALPCSKAEAICTIALQQTLDSFGSVCKMKGSCMYTS